MRINSGIAGGPSGVGIVRSKGDAAAAASPAKVSGTPETNDVVSVSSTAQLVAAAREKIGEMPVVRASKIDAIQSQMNSGTYRPDSSAVVDGLLREHMQRSG